MGRWRKGTTKTSCARHPLTYIDKATEAGVQQTVAWLKSGATSPSWLTNTGKRLEELDTRANTAKEFGDDTVVLNSSVADRAGCGLYALKGFRKGQRILAPYPGECATAESFDELNDFLVALTQQRRHDGCERPTTGIIRRCDKNLAILKRRWNITVRRTGGLWQPNWDALYDQLIAFRFDNDCGDVFYWGVYGWDGRIRAQPTTQRNAALFLNEPAPYDRFVNRFTLEEQLSRSNVAACTDGAGDVIFYATRPIRYGDEILLEYGPFYNRTYATTRSEPCAVFKAASIDNDIFIQAVAYALNAWYNDAESVITEEEEEEPHTPLPPRRSKRLKIK